MASANGVSARGRAEQRYRLLSSPGSATAAAAVEQLRAALAVEQLVQPAVEGAARQSTAAAAAISSGAAAKKGQPAAAAATTTAPQQRT